MKLCIGSARPLLLLALGAAVAQAHSIWIEPQSDGYQAFFGEVEAGERDTLKAELGFDKARAFGLDGKAIPVVVAVDRLQLKTAQPGIALVQEATPVHGEGKEAGRGVFLARFLKDSTELPAEASARALDLRPVPKERWKVVLTQGGKPLADREVSVRSPEGKSSTLRTGTDGTVSLPKQAPGIWQLSSWIEVKETGTHLGKAYAKVWHVASLGLERR